MPPLKKNSFVSCKQSIRQEDADMVSLTCRWILCCDSKIQAAIDQDACNPNRFDGDDDKRMLSTRFV